jgi:hypothetical protein
MQQQALRRLLQGGFLGTLAAAVAVHNKDNFPIVLPVRVAAGRNILVIPPEHFTKYRDCGGRSAPTKIKLHGANLGAFAKSIPETAVYRDAIKARVVEYTFNKLFGPGNAPKSYIGVSYDTFKARIFNTVDTALKALGMVKKNAAPYGTLFSISTVVGINETDSLSSRISYLRDHNLLDHNRGGNVVGFGVSLLLSNVLSGDPNAGNIIERFITEGNEEDSKAYPIDGEVDPTNAILFFPTGSGINAQQECFNILRAGWLTEAMDTEEQRVNTLVTKIDPIGFTETAADPLRVYSEKEINYIAEMMLHDVKHGLLEQAYQTLAELDEATLYEITADLDIPDSHRAEIIGNVIMPRIREITEHLATSTQQTRSRALT